jgi:L-ascorbate metabolism protein UlaG (beta-lactamase superfamily)
MAKLARLNRWRSSTLGSMFPAITFLGHATVLIEIDGVRVLTDPVLHSRLLFLDRVVRPISPANYADIDIVLISHLHHDHCDIRSLALLRSAVVIVPVGAGAYLRRHARLPRIVELAENTTIERAGLIITAVHADHDGKRVPFGPSAPAIGFVITGSDTTTYFAGDTDVYPQMATLPMPEAKGLDMALLPVWGWGPNLGPGHMDSTRAVDALELLEPAAAMPIHWGTLFPRGMRRVLRSSNGLLTRPPQQFAEIAAERTADIEVAVVQPGHPWVSK